ncbi:MAG: ATP-dependent sacrificial sulfur transferase LarE [Elusimicrobiota bacterium]|nr:ATP-dependent sacrificial sulfur transferase LarE [Elusimicrobiota bacterium]
MDITSKIKNLIDSINTFNKIIIAYSGGVDSGLLTFLCKYLNKNVIAVTAVSELIPKEEIEYAKTFTKKYKIKHIFIKTNELKNTKFTKNTIYRCYWCKTELFSKLKKLKEKLNYDVIFDGVNLDDMKSDFRPGINAAYKFGIVHPYTEAKITKQDIRKIAKKFNLPFWSKPAYPCLASRIPFGIEINKKILNIVYNAEKIIKTFWQKFFRVRHHNEILRIELNKKDIKNFITKVDINKLINKLKTLGYKFITLDLEGYTPSGKRFINFMQYELTKNTKRL